MESRVARLIGVGSRCYNRPLLGLPAIMEADLNRGSRRLGGQPNKKHTKADWPFTTTDARVKLKRLYPAM
jgi:hypothetical protein